MAQCITCNNEVEEDRNYSNWCQKCFDDLVDQMMKMEYEYPEGPYSFIERSAQND